jgi:hypothetical protein
MRRFEKELSVRGDSWMQGKVERQQVVRMGVMVLSSVGYSVFALPQAEDDHFLVLVRVVGAHAEEEVEDPFWVKERRYLQRRAWWAASTT